MGGTVSLTSHHQGVFENCHRVTVGIRGLCIGVGVRCNRIPEAEPFPIRHGQHPVADPADGIGAAPRDDQVSVPDRRRIEAALIRKNSLIGTRNWQSEVVPLLAFGIPCPDVSESVGIVQSILTVVSDDQLAWYAIRLVTMLL